MSGGPQVFLGATAFLSDRIAVRSPTVARLSHWVRGCLWPHGCSGRRRARPPARLGVLTSFGAAPRSPPVPSGPSGALHTCGARPRHRPRHRSQASQASRRPPIGRPSYSTMSHVIRLRVFQTLKSHRWDCNVLREPRKLTPGNYVRLLCVFGFVLGLVVGAGQALERFITATSMHAPIAAAMTVGRIQPSWFAWSGLHMSTELMCSG